MITTRFDQDTGAVPPPSATPVRILLVDDHQLVTDSLTMLLAEDPRFKVVGGARDGRSALALVRNQHVDIVLLDISMPELNGLDAIRLFARDFPHVKICVLSMHSADSYVLEAVRLGVKGYVLKSAAGTELKAAVDTIAGGGCYFSPDINTVLAKYIQSCDSDYISGVLSGREREVLQLIGEGKTLREVARVLSISEKTVKNHRDNIAGKLDCRSTADLVKQAIRLGLTTE